MGFGAALRSGGIDSRLGTFLDIDVSREKAAFEAAQNALRLSSHAAPHEKRYVEALATRYSGGPKNPSRRLQASHEPVRSRKSN